MLCSYKEKIAHWEWYDADKISSTNDEINTLSSEHIVRPTFSWPYDKL